MFVVFSSLCYFSKIIIILTYDNCIYTAASARRVCANEKRQSKKATTRRHEGRARKRERKIERRNAFPEPLTSNHTFKHICNRIVIMFHGFVPRVPSMYIYARLYIYIMCINSQLCSPHSIQWTLNAFETFIIFAAAGARAHSIWTQRGQYY